MQATVHFLQGDAYSLGLPEAFDPSPELRSTIRLAGSRHVSYKPKSPASTPPADDPLLARIFQVSTSFTRVVVYRTLDDPYTLIPFWALPDGHLETFVQAEPGCSDEADRRVRAIIRDLGVSISRLGLPLLRFEGEIEGPDPSQWIQREMIVFSPIDREAD